MELYIFNRNIELLGVIDCFTSLIWTRSYTTCGSFKLVANTTKENIELLTKENIIYKKNDTEAGIIDTINIDINREGKEIITAQGRFITSYLARRINYKKLVFSGKYEILMRTLVDRNCITTTEKRVIDNLGLGELNNYSGTVKYQNSYGNLLDLLEDLALESSLGFRVDLDPVDKKMSFNIYKGVDRSYSSTTPCIFSREYENILDQSYTNSNKNYRNMALVCGKGEDENRVKVEVNEEAAGLDRYELYVDADNIENTDENGKVIIEEDYINLLRQRGNEKLAAYYESLSFEGKVNTLGNNKYKVNYDLGDIVTIMDRKWGVKIDVRITEIEEVYEEKGLEINITFGNAVPTLVDKIKQVVK